MMPMRIRTPKNVATMAAVERADGDVKIAVLLGLGWERADAIEALKKHESNLRTVIDELAHD